MPNLPHRIRYARRLARLSQTQLSLYVNVARSAVAQWEKSDGATPTTKHLIEIATVTNTSLEWLATGRGQAKAHITTQTDGLDMASTSVPKEPKLTAMEKRFIRAVREMPTREALAILQMMESLSSQKPTEDPNLFSDYSDV